MSWTQKLDSEFFIASDYMCTTRKIIISKSIIDSAFNSRHARVTRVIFKTEKQHGKFYYFEITQNFSPQWDHQWKLNIKSSSNIIKEYWKADLLNPNLTKHYQTVYKTSLGYDLRILTKRTFKMLSFVGQYLFFGSNISSWWHYLQQQ